MTLTDKIPQAPTPKKREPLDQAIVDKALKDYDDDLCPAPGIFVRAVRDLRIQLEAAKHQSEVWHSIADRNVARANLLEGTRKLKWESVHSAPKDGTHILLMWRCCSYPSIGFWADDSVRQGWRCIDDNCIPINQEDCLFWHPIPAL